MKTDLQQCPVCKEWHLNQEFGDYCDLDCAISDRRKWMDLGRRFDLHGNDAL